MSRVGVGPWRRRTGPAMRAYCAAHGPRFIQLMEWWGVMRQSAWSNAPWVEAPSRLHGHRMRLDLSDYYQRFAAVMGCYHEVHVLAVIRRGVRAGEAMIDGGSNTGVLACHAAGWLGPAGRLDAFEANPASADQTAWHFEANELTQCHLHRVGLADAEGEATVSMPDPGNTGSATLHGSPERLARWSRDVARIRTRAIDVALRDEGLERDERPLLIKLDIEGSELAALRGAEATIDRRRPAIVMEVNDEMLALAGASVEDVARWLASRGYEPFAFRRGWMRRLYRLSLHPLGTIEDLSRARDALWIRRDGPHWSRYAPLIGGPLPPEPPEPPEADD